MSVYSVTKGMLYTQTNNGTPGFLPFNEYVFAANVYSVESNVIRSAFIESTNLLDCILDQQDPTEFQFDDLESDPRDLRAKYPFGRYRYWIRTLNDGYRTNLSLMLTGAHPTVPRILNFTELQSASGTGFVQVSWAPFVGGRAIDSIQLRIESLSGGRAFETRDFGEPGALDGRATNVVIEPGNLRPNTTYIAWLEFRKTSQLNTNSYPGAVGWGYLHRRTEFRIRTSSAEAPDAESYEVSKGRRFVQLDGAGPVPDGTNAFQFIAEVQARNPASLVSGELTLAGGGIVPLEVAANQLAVEVSSASPIDTAYPEGAYTFNVDTQSDGERVLPLNLSPSSYPPAPRIRNLDPTRLIPFEDLDIPLLVEWDSWLDGRASDFIQLQVRNGGTNVFETGDFGDNDALNGFATSFLIPTNTFARGETYTLRLTFRRFTDLNTTQYPGALGAASFFSRTDFEVIPINDIESYEIASGRHFIQTSTAQPEVDGTNAYRFLAELQAQTPTNSVLSGSVLLPNNAGSRVLSNEGGGDFAFEESSVDPLVAYPNGTYTTVAQTVHEGSRSMPLTLSGDAFPPAPYFLHDPQQRVPHEQPVNMTWAAWPGGTANDFVQLQIRDSGTNVFETPDFGEDGALNGLATSATVPAGLLVRGERYTARLLFQRNVDTNTTSFPGAVGIAFYYSRTDSDLRTIGPDVEDYEIERGLSFVQNSSTEVVPEGGEELLFNAQVQASSPGLIENAVFVLPADLSVPMVTDPSLEQFEHSDFGSNPEDFNSVYTEGEYRFVVTTVNDGTQSLALLVTNVVYPPTPRVSNFQFGLANPIPAGPPVPIQWDPWTGGTSNDFIQVQIRDSGTNVFETPNFGDDGALTGLATNTVLPPNLLLPGKNYGARIFFRRFSVIDESIPGSVGTVGFFTRLKFDLSTLEPDVQSYSLFKGTEYLQTSTNPPSPTAYVFEAALTSAFAGNTVSFVRVTPPGRPTIELTPDNNRAVFKHRASFATQAELDANFPNGAYVMELQGVSYGRTNITFFLTNASPAPPRVANYPDAGRINAAQNFVLSWDPLAGGTLGDFVSVIMASPAGGPGFISPEPGDQGALDGLDTTVLMPRGTLLANARYDGSVSFEKLLINDETTFLRVPGRVGYYARTNFRALTTGAGNPPRFSARLFEFVSGNRVQYVMGTIPLGAYIIEGSTNLVNWTPITNFTALSEFFTNTAARPPGPSFFIRSGLQR